jgi:hypothetical protein
MLFLVLYAVGIVELELESTSALILLMFIIPLAFTLSGFLMWILYSLNSPSNNIYLLNILMYMFQVQWCS